MIVLFQKLMLLIPFFVVLSSLTFPWLLTYTSASATATTIDANHDKQYYEYTTQLIPVYVPPLRRTKSGSTTKTKGNTKNTNTNTNIRTFYDSSINLNVYIVTTSDVFSVLIPKKKIQYTKKQTKLRTTTADLYTLYMKEYESDLVRNQQEQEQQQQELNVTTTTTTTTTRIFKIPYIKRDEQITYHHHPYRQQPSTNSTTTNEKTLREQQDWILQKTLYQGTKNNCLVASNGGPYNPNGSPVGSVISYGTIISDNFVTTNNPTNYIGFGLTKPIILTTTTGNVIPVIQHQTLNTSTSSSSTGSNTDTVQKQQYWIVGNIYNTTMKQYNYNINPTIDIEQYVTGFDWLIYNNTNVVNSDSGTTGASLAPRTAIGITLTGKLVIITVDGYGEKWFRYQGITLHYFAQLLLNNYTTTTTSSSSTTNNDKIVYAINMDGGGSTTLVSKILQSQQQQQQNQEQSSSNNNKLHYVNRPTCIDIPIQCERRISTVLCIKERFT